MHFGEPAAARPRHNLLRGAAAPAYTKNVNVSVTAPSASYYSASETVSH